MKSLKDKLLFFLITNIAYIYIRLVSFTIKVSVQNFENTEIINKQKVIFAIWHNRLFYFPYYFKYRFKTSTISVLTSQSKDGRYIGKVLEKFGHLPIYGSTKKGGAMALKNLAKTNYHKFITVDGPKGPIYEIKPGIIKLAEITGLPIVPLSYKIDKYKELNSWDRFILPYPFSKCTISFGKPIYVERKPTPEKKDNIEHNLKNTLLALND